MDEYREANRALWNAWTRINLQSEMYDVQCHFGMDTIRWAKHGATVTGVDFSDQAVTAARALATRMGVPATFVHCDLYDLPAKLEGRFDVAFTSHGVLCWLPDLERWAQVIAHFLAPGGLLYIVDAHPFLQIFNDRLAEPDLRLLYPYFHGPEPIRDEHPGCFSAPDAPITSIEHVWLHTVSDLINALVRAGLRITAFEEYPFLAWRFFPWMERGADGWWRLPEDPRLPLGRGSLPLMFSLKAIAPAETP